MKTTIDIADDLFERIQRLARKEKTTFRALAEAGLRLKGLIQQISHWTKAGNVERNLVKLACDTYGQAEEKS